MIDPVSQVDLNAAEVRGIETGDNSSEGETSPSVSSDFRRAVLIACSVEKLGRGKSSNDDSGKVAAATFAGMVNAPGFSDNTIGRILDRWAEASEAEPEDYLND